MASHGELSPTSRCTSTLRNGCPIEIRPATVHDLPGVFAIYDYEVQHSTATFDTNPKTEPERVEWFHLSSGKYPFFVAVDLSSEVQRILGWSRLYAYSPRRAYDRTAEVAVYTHVDARGLGIGKLLLEKLIAACPGLGVRVLLAKITSENVGSIALHEKYGFKTFGVLPRAGEKFGRVLDVTFMSLPLEGEELK